MSTTLLVHPGSLALTTLPRVGSSSGTPLAFPSRYPAGAAPRTALSPFSSSTYLWADAGSVVFEYDARGRRTGEIKLGARERVRGVACVDGGIVLATTQGAGIWRRGEGNKWTKTTDLEVPTNLTAMDAADAIVLAGDEVLIYDSAGARLDPGFAFATPLRCVCAVRGGLLAPTPDGVTLVSLAGQAPVSFALPGPAAALAASRSSDRAAAAVGTSVVFLSLSSGQATPVDVGAEVAGLAWLDGQNVAARTSAGRLLLVTGAGDVSEAKVGEPVLGVHVLAPKRGRAVSDRPRPLGESGAPNRPASAPQDEKKRFASAPSAPPPAIPAIERLRGEGKGSPKGSPKHTPRERARSPQSVRTGGTERIRPLDPEHTRMAAVLEDAGSVASSPRSPRSAAGTPAPHSRPSSGEWGKRTSGEWAGALGSPPAIESGGAGAGGSGWAAFEEMRREIANLQLDMLRMGRGLKNEIRAAVGPLVEEVRANREVIARQAAEIERLRRGY